MSYTKKNRILRRSTYKKPRETKISVGPSGHIRCVHDLGQIYLSTLPEDISIDGCDWKGALAIYNFLPSKHKSITNGVDYYFMIANADGNINRENAVFIIIFHHLYNIFLQKEPFICPPFRSPIQTKYEFLQKVFLKSCDHLDEADLVTIQTVLKQKVYSSWSEYLELFINPWSFPVSVKDHSYDDRILSLKAICENAQDVLDFLMSPIDEVEKIITKLVPLENTNTNGLCNILIDKLDHHIIFQQTGIKPISTDWLRELDLFLFL